MSSITTRDGVSIHYKDWGPRTGQAVVLSHGWPLNADSCESQAFYLASNGFRVIAHAGIARQLGGAYGLGITYPKTTFGASEGH